ncbi:hypothetical protein [Helicobacter salomonis]|uniref:hypothetical protein n=1 Tax=Helicobacter salomonis TaxID=56878 RepID=UPI000CF18B14|nr:hypothetical protein [Helicobacter salomonis]
MESSQIEDFTIESDFTYILEEVDGQWALLVQGWSFARVSSRKHRWMADVCWENQGLAYHNAYAHFMIDGQELRATLKSGDCPDYYTLQFHEDTDKKYLQALKDYLKEDADHRYVHSVVRIVVRDGKVLRGYACAFEINIDAARARAARCKQERAQMCASRHKNRC